MKVIPQDLIEEILLRLPVKSLCRLKSVCRSWHDVISDHNFVRAQINHAKTSYHHGEKDHTLLLYFRDPDAGSQITVCDKRRIDDELYNPLLSRSIDLPLVPYLISTSCDGMFCVTVTPYECGAYGICHLAHRSVFLWNPIIHDLKRLPLPFAMEHSVCDCGSDFHEDYNCSQCSFGYDIFAVGHNPSIEDYYICKIPTIQSPPDSPVELLYLKSNSNWKPIANLWPRYQVFYQRPTYFNDILYCVARRVIDADDHQNVDADVDERCLILRYNEVEENFEEIALPEIFTSVELDIIQGHHPRLIACMASCQGAQYWLYNEEDSSWSFFQHFPNEYYVFSEYHELCLPFCVTSSCIYFLKQADHSGTGGANYDETGVIKYDFETETTCYYKKWTSRGIRFSYKLELIESLMSPTRLISPPPHV